MIIFNEFPTFRAARYVDSLQKKKISFCYYYVYMYG